MSISREYYDEEGNYWQIETPYYIPPKEAIKHKEYVRGFRSAKERAAAKRFKRMNRIIELTMMSLVVILVIAVVVKRFVV